MKKETAFFTGNATILKQETVMDVIKGITQQPGQEDPFYVLDVGDIVRKIKIWRMKMPRVEPFYAVKCNDNVTVLETLASLGTGFDCASKGELKKVVDLGVDPSRIIYAHPCKPASHIRQAAELNVPLMTFDNLSELYKIKDIYPTAKLVIRIRCDAIDAQCELGIKFGVLPEHAPALLDAASTLGLDIVGVSFHVGSGCREPPVFQRAISAARNVFDYAISIGYSPTLLDIGGGFPGTAESNLDQLAYYINNSIEKHFPEKCNVKIIAEPGRYVVASAFTLATCVVSYRNVCDTNDAKVSTMYYINDGVYGSFNCIFYDHQDVHPKIIKNIPEGKATICSSIWGPTCDGLDQVVSDVQLPELEIGDWIVWENMGAYTLAACNNFNGFPIPSIKVVMHLHTWLYLEEFIGSALLNEKESASVIEQKGHRQGQPIHEDATQFFANLAIVDGKTH